MKYVRMSILAGIVGTAMILSTAPVLAEKQLTEFNKYNAEDMILILDSEEYCVKQMEQTYFCNAKSGLNIREFCTSDSRIIGGYEFGERIVVKGEVFLEDESTNWMMVEIGKKTGYVYKKYLSEKNPVINDVVRLINSKGDVTTAYELADGTYLDRIDRHFTFDGYENWICDDGSVWNLTYDSTNDDGRNDSAYTGAEDIVELINARGDTTTAYLLADGSYMDRIDRIFYYDGKETWNCTDGSQWNKTVD